MTRLRAYRIECDACGVAVDAGSAFEAEADARAAGWLLRSKKHGDLCSKCRKDAREDDLNDGAWTEPSTTGGGTS